MDKQHIIKITKNSLSLEKYGMNELAWVKNDAQNLIEAIMKDHIGILGGDVYELRPERIVPLYDNWYCEQTNNESEEEYFARSKIESLNYIKNYLIESVGFIVFSLTFTQKIF